MCLNHCASEFYAEGLDGYLAIVQPNEWRLIMIDRPCKAKVREEAWDEKFMKDCLGGFGQTESMLLLGGVANVQFINNRTKP